MDQSKLVNYRLNTVKVKEKHRLLLNFSHRTSLFFTRHFTYSLSRCLFMFLF